jgi:hypothetical protein
VFKEVREQNGSSGEQHQVKSKCETYLTQHVKICIETEEISPKIENTLINKRSINSSKVQF